MRILLASDHAGYELKTQLQLFLRKSKYDVIDYGPHEVDPEDDYPDYIAPVAHEVSTSQGETVGIVIGGSGQGEAMVANRFANIRAVVYYGNPISRSDLESEKRSDLDVVRLSREHNNSNILSLGARFITFEEAKKAVSLWLLTPFSGDERHVRRIKKIETVTSRISIASEDIEFNPNN